MFGLKCGEPSWGVAAPSSWGRAGLCPEVWFFPGLVGGPQGGWHGGACADDKPPPPEPLSSVSSLEVHFDLLDLTELTDMSDQELAEVFADSDDENLAGDSPAGGAGAGVRRAARAGPGVRPTGRCSLQTPTFENNFLSIVFK